MKGSKMTKILNFGSLNVDYVYHVDHFVAPGETIASSARDVNCGGKGLNQSVALASCGAEVYHAGKIGSDGSMLTALLNKAGVDTSLVGISDGPSGHAIIQVDKNGQNSIILFPGSNHEINTPMISKVMESFGKSDFVVLQNEISGIAEIMKLAAAKGMKIIFNPSPITPEILTYPLELVSLFVVNEIEAAAVSGTDDFSSMPAALKQKYPNAEFLITFGTNGAVFVSGDRLVKYGIHKAPVADTTAAGDTMLGFFTGLTSKGYEPEAALKLATKASAVTVSRKGAAPSIPTLKEAEECSYPYKEFTLF